MITIGQEGGMFVWHWKRPGSTRTSNERFALLPDAVATGRMVAKCKGERFVEPVIEIEPEVQIYEDSEPEVYGFILPTDEIPVDYTEEMDAEAVEGFMYSLKWAGAIV
jgi:hypothetical protein